MIGVVYMSKTKPTFYLDRDCVILDSLNEGVFTVDLDWRITSFNRAAEQITGISRQEAIGARCYEVFRTSICENDCALRQTFASGKPILDKQALIVDSDGRRIPIRLGTAQLKDSAGKVIGGVESFQDLSQLERLQKELSRRYGFEDIIGQSAAMQRLFDVLPQIAESSSNVLIEGASGTGKELFARAIHQLSPRGEKPFVAVNCAALPDTLLESELFGYKAGAFTDAKKDKPGRFALAEGGTIFLDEIGDISAAMQVRLLRVLQERVIEPLGAIQAQPIDVRVICATNRDLHELMKTEKFRQDLYYRIKVVSLSLPGLAQRREDIPLLIEHMIDKFNHLQDRHILGVSEEVMQRLMEYDFPGNVRELENIIEQAFVLCRGALIESRHLPPELRPEADASLPGQLPMKLEELEKLSIEEALRKHDGNRKLTAAALGIDTSTLFRKIKTHKIKPPARDGRSRKK